MNGIGSRIRTRRTELGMSQQALARESGLSQSTITQLETGMTKSSKHIVEIANTLRVHPSWLQSGKGMMEIVVSGDESIQPQRDDFIRLAVRDIYASAGNGFPNKDYPDVIRYIDINKEWIRDNLRINPKNTSIITIHGDSMSPTFEDKDIVIFDSSIKVFQGDGIYVFTIDGETKIKRLQRLIGNRLAVISDNSFYQTETIEGELLNAVKIQGKAVAKNGIRIVK